MKLELSRRDLFLAGGGAVAGIALSPVPWKLLDDLSIWTQQPPTPTPRPAGPLAFRFTSCALCPAACGLKARCFGAQPVGFAAVPGHPASDGGLCPLGLTAHHLAKHPLRATRPERVSGGKRERIDRAAAVAALSAALAACGKDPKRTFAVVDGRPGRSLSRTYRALAAATGGLYVTPPAAGAALSLEALGKRFDGGPLALGVDFAKARRVVSFGTPGPDRRRDARPPRAPARREPPPPGRRADRGDPGRGDPQPERRPRRPLRPDRPRNRGRLRPRPRARPPRREARRRGVPRRADERARRASPASPPASPRPSSSRRPASRPASSSSLARDLAANRPALVLGGDPAAAPLSGETEAAIAALNLLLGAPFGPLPARGRGAPRGGRRREARRRHLARRAPRRLRRAPPPRRDGGRGARPVGRASSARSPTAPSSSSLSPFRAGLGEKATLLLPGPAPLEETRRAGRARRRAARDPRLRPRPPGAAEGPRPPRRRSSARRPTAAGLSLPAPAAGAAPRRSSRRSAAGSTTRPRPRSSRSATSPPPTPSASSSRAAPAGSTTRPPSRRGASPSFGDGEAPRLLEAALGAPSALPARPASLPREAVSAAPPSLLLTKLTRETALFTRARRRAPRRRDAMHTQKHTTTLPAHRYTLVVDLDRCTGCGACGTACAVENNIPPAHEKATERTGIVWMRVHEVPDRRGRAGPIDVRPDPLPAVRRTRPASTSARSAPSSTTRAPASSARSPSAASAAATAWPPARTTPAPSTGGPGVARRGWRRR